MRPHKELFVFGFKVGGDEACSQTVLVSTSDCSMLKSEMYTHGSYVDELKKLLRESYILINKIIEDKHGIFKMDRFLENFPVKIITDISTQNNEKQ